MRLLPAAILLLLSCTPAPAGPPPAARDAPENGVPEQKLKHEIAETLADLAEWCNERGARVEGRALAAEILYIAPRHRRARVLQVPLMGDSTATSDDLLALRVKQDTTGRVVAPLYLQLFARKHRPGLNAIYDVYLLRALQHDRALAAPVFDRTWRRAERRKDWSRARMLVDRGSDFVDIPDREQLLARFDASEMAEIREQLVPGGSFVLKFPELGPTVKKDSRLVQMQVVLPKDYAQDRQWPVYISLGGGSGSHRPNRLAEGLGFVSVGLPYPRNPLNLDQAAFRPQTLWSCYKPMLDKLDRVLPNLHPTDRVVFGFSNGANAITALVAFSDGEFVRQYPFLVIHEGGTHQHQWTDEVWSDLQSCALFYSGGDQAGGQRIARMHAEAVEHDVDAELLIFSGRHEINKEVRDAVRAWMRHRVAD